MPQINISVADFAKYLPKDYQPSVIIDLGAHFGQEAAQFSDAYHNARIYAFEASPRIANLCMRQMAKYPRVTVVPMAVSDKDGEMTFYHSPLTPQLWYSSSALPFAQGRGIKVKGTRLDTWLAANKIQKPDLLWADLQGGEAAALRGMGSRLKELDGILLEVWYKPATYTGLTMLPDINGWLKLEGFEMVENRPTNDIWGDAIWIRKGL